MVYLHSSLKSKPTARPWQDWCIWRERVVGSRLQRATKHWEVREGCLQIQFMFLYNAKEGWGDLNSKD